MWDKNNVKFVLGMTMRMNDLGTMLLRTSGKEPKMDSNYRFCVFTIIKLRI